MAEVDDFLDATMERLIQADTALHNGDAGPRTAMWSHNDPVTLLGAAVSNTGWRDIRATFEWLGARFSNCESFEIEVLAAGASGDLAYLVAIERTTASIGSEPPVPYSLRVTTVFRREDGEWKVVHRHADPLADSVEVRDRLVQLDDEGQR